MITIAETTASRGRPGIIARLLAEDWDQMTAAANASKRHIGSLDRWVDIARAKNPGLTEEQAERLARLLRTQHFREMGRASAAARAAARARNEPRT